MSDWIKFYVDKAQNDPVTKSKSMYADALNKIPGANIGGNTLAGGILGSGMGIGNVFQNSLIGKLAPNILGCNGGILGGLLKK